MSMRAWRGSTQIFRRRIAVSALKTMVWVALIGTVAASVAAVGIRIVGSIDDWQRWLAANRGYLFAWRMILYALTAYGWWRIRQHLRAREPSDESRNRLRRAEIAALITLALLEGSQLLQPR
jgi:hypothetical protein